VAEGLIVALRPGGSASLVRIGLALVLAGAGFLIGAAPLHMHAVDLWQGAPAPVAGLMAAAPGVTAILVLVRLVAGPFGYVARPIREALLVLGAVGVVVGVLTAWAQTDARRTAGHLAVAIAGAVLVGFCQVAALGDATWTALLLAVVVMVYLALGFLAAMLGATAHAGTGPPDRPTVLRRSVAGGAAWLLALLAGHAGMVLLFGAARVRPDGAARWLLLVCGLGLLAGAARLAILFREQAIKKSDRASQALRFAAAGVVAVALAVMLAPLVFTDAVRQALRDTWPP
jgi:NADH:ubiquinone oxidoreductase subunit 2 (subunit N)